MKPLPWLQHFVTLRVGFFFCFFFAFFSSPVFYPPSLLFFKKIKKVTGCHFMTLIKETFLPDPSIVSIFRYLGFFFFHSNN